ncbi:MAG: AAA family ATPase, partial [Synergistales bacterium]|nr:AAA family ATPase [Synergistales bacterium]
MKILEIELKNLNSLRGRWRIDLSDNLYETNGIFAITGPTGAGKTTIFDAVCLALYGQTPRLVSINDKQNEIMSRRSDECYAKVIFESEGKKFISLWSQHKSGAKNKLQKQKHILSDAESGEIFSDKVSETPKIIQEITGLDFRRFKQAVMLEQGGFDAFLKADKNERAEILELLTGTKIYSEISKLVYIRAGQEQNELNNIKIQRDSLKPNDDFNDEDEILNAMSLAGKNLLSAENQQAEAKNAIDWLKNIQKLENDIAENQHEFEQHKKRVEIFTTDQRKLETGLKAAELLGDYSNLKAQRSNFKKISEHVEKIKNEIEQELEILSQTEEKEIPELESIYKKITKDVPENETPESLGARAKERAILFSGIAKEKQDTEIAKKEAEKKFQTAQAALTSAEKNYSQYQEEYAKAAKKFEELVSMRAEAIFDDARRNLQPGTPCPVCGATEHPNANFLEEKNFGDISKFDDALKIARQQTKTAHEKLNEAHKNYSAVKSIESSARTNLDNLISEFNKISERRSVSRLEIDELMKQMGISVKVVADIMPRINVWLQDVATLNEKIKRAKERREFLKNQIEANKKNLSSQNSELENLSDELKKLESDFISALHEKNFENEKIFNAAKVDYDELKKLQNRKQELEGEKNRLQGVKDNLEQKLKAESEKAITSRNLAELLPEFKEREKLINTLKE